MWLSINVHRCLPNYYRFYWSEFKGMNRYRKPFKMALGMARPAFNCIRWWLPLTRLQVGKSLICAIERNGKHRKEHANLFLQKSVRSTWCWCLCCFLSKVTQTQQMPASLLINIRKRLITFTFHPRMSRANYRTLTQMPQPCCTSCKSLLNIITSFPPCAM